MYHVWEGSEVDTVLRGKNELKKLFKRLRRRCVDSIKMGLSLFL
jgi:hypothetical protein